MTLAALLLAALHAAPAPAAPAAPAGATLVVRARGLDEVALQRALRPRSGGGAVVLLRQTARVDPDHIFIDLDLDPPELGISIILRDGRAYVRRVPAPEAARDIARLVASMLVAIDGDDLAPLPERVTSPALAAAIDRSRRAAEIPLAVPVEGGEFGREHPGGASNRVLPPEPSSRPIVRRDRSARASSGRPQLELGLAAAPLFGLGVPNRRDAGVRGGGGELRLDLRGAGPWLVSAGLRASGDAATGPAGGDQRFGLARLRLGLGGGVWLRRGRLDLRAIASASIEPWFVTHRGRRVRLGERAGLAPLLGGHLKLIVAPAILRSDRLYLGIFGELALSAAPSGRALELRLDDHQFFALGGLEAALGLELRGCLGPTPDRRR